MNRLVILFIVMLFSMTSCGTAKQAMSQETSAVKSEATSDSTDLDKVVRSIINDIISQDLARLIVQEQEIFTTKYSPPDSLGKQFILEVQQIKNVNRTEENASVKKQTVEDKIIQIDSTTVSASIEDLVIDEKIDTKTKQGLPWWQKTLMLSGVAALALLIIRIILKIAWK